MSDRCGITPLPITLEVNDTPSSLRVPYTPLEVTYDPSLSIVSDPQQQKQSQIQQPLQQELASFVAERADYTLYGASIIAVNANFIVYAVKNGLIRILSRHSTTLSLLRLHKNEIVSDIQFFHDGEYLATVSATASSATSGDGTLSSRVIVWRVYPRGDIIVTEPMLEIRSTTKKMVRVVWHPRTPNQFFIIHSCIADIKTMMATLVETTNIATTNDPHAVADFQTFSSLQPNGKMMVGIRNVHMNASLHDLAWSGVDINCVMVGYGNGDLIIYDLNASHIHPSVLDAPQCVSESGILHKISQPSSINRCLLLPHYDAVHTNITTTADSTSTKHMYTSCFVTGSGDNNSTLTLWSSMTLNSKPMVLQTIHIATSPPDMVRSYVLNTCYGPSTSTSTTPPPPSCFILAGCREVGRVYAFHIQAQWSNPSHEEPNPRVLLLGTNYVVPFITKYPILSCNITCAPSTNTNDYDDLEDEDLANGNNISTSINFDMKLFVYQTAAVQCLQLTSQMCWPPTVSYTATTPGVTVQRTSNGDVVLETQHNPTSTAMTEIHPIDDFEEYEIDETEDDEYDAAPDPLSLPIPSSSIISGSQSTNSSSGTSNPFSNWLGAFATTKSPPAAEATTTMISNPIIPTTMSNPNVMTPNANTSAVATPPTSQDATTTLLSPMEILGLIPVKKSNTSSTEGTGTATTNDDTVASMPRSTTTNANENRVSEINPTIIPEGDNVATSTANGMNYEDLENTIRTILKEELVPSIRRDMLDMVQPMVDLINPIQTSINELHAQQSQNGVNASNESERITTAVTTNLEETMRAMFTECTRTVLIPTIESVTGQIFTKVAEHLDARNSHDNSKFETISRQLASTSTLIAELTKEVNLLRNELHNKAPPMEPIVEPIVAPITKQPDVDPYDQQRNEIMSYIKERNYEAAFRRAVSNKTVDMALFCCHSVEIHDVFGDSQPAVSQPILLCLMQQLGTVLDSSPDAQFIVDWLQEITIALYPPVDPQINPHLPAVVKNLVTNLMKRIARADDDPALRRSLQKLQSLLRGMH